MIERNGYLQDNTAISRIITICCLLTSHKIWPILVILALSGTTSSTYLASFQTLLSALWAGDPLFCHHGIFQRSLSFILLVYITLMSNLQTATSFCKCQWHWSWDWVHWQTCQLQLCWAWLLHDCQWRCADELQQQLQHWRCHTSYGWLQWASSAWY